MGRRLRPHVNPLSIRTRHTFAGFPDAREIVVDIGAYKGEFIAALAARFPLRHYIVFEVRARAAQRLRERFRDHPNIVVFDGDATRNFRAILEPCQQRGAMIREIYVNFPDPWPKARHHKRRILTERFLASCEAWLDPRATWIFQTDRADLFRDTMAILRRRGYATERFFAPPYGIPTDWEIAQRRRGATIYRVRFWIGVPQRSRTPWYARFWQLVRARLLAGTAYLALRWLYVTRADDQRAH